MKRVWVLACVLALVAVGCASLPTRSSIIEADEKMVAGCSFVTTLHETVNRSRRPHLVPGRAANADAMDVAKLRLFTEAEKQGATHVVIEAARAMTFAGAGSLQGKAYRCAAAGPRDQE